MHGNKTIGNVDLFITMLALIFDGQQLILVYEENLHEGISANHLLHEATLNNEPCVYRSTAVCVNLNL